MADGVLGICNTALIALGEDPITTLQDPTRRAMLCAQRYDAARKVALQAHTWTEARGRAALAAAAVGPEFGYAYTYALPGDFIRMVEIDDDSAWSWQVEGRHLLTDFGPPCNVIYVRDLTDTGIMSQMLADVIALQLADDLCMALTQSGEKKRLVQQDLAELRGRAQTASSQQDSPREWDDDVWLRARR